jgi:ArsR family transcriptional regulator, arsenate/arsenite/antimonite-responsive transcriptional repressor
LLTVTASGAYRALAGPTRREILRLLREGDLPAGRLAGAFDISWPSVSRHLRVLESAGLVSSQRKGGNIIYSLQTSVLQDVATEVAEMAGVGRRASRPTRRAPSPRRRPRPEQA